MAKVNEVTKKLQSFLVIMVITLCMGGLAVADAAAAEGAAAVGGVAPGAEVQFGEVVNNPVLDTNLAVVNPSVMSPQELNATSALWFKKNIVRVTFRGNGHTGGSVPAARDVRTPGSLVIPGPGNMVRANHRFDGWTDPGGRIWRQGSVARWNTKSKGTWTLTARWLPNAPSVPTSVRLTFNGNGGTPATQTLTRQPGTRVGTLPTATRAGHRFVGWFTTSAATGGTQFTANSTVPNTNTTYWARWVLNDITLTFKGNGG